MEKQHAKTQASNKAKTFGAQDAPLLQKLKRSGTLAKQRKLWVALWFDFVFEQYKADEVLETGFAKWILTLHFCLVGVASIELEWLLDTSPTAKNVIRDNLLAGVTQLTQIILLSLVGLFGVLSVLCLVLRRKHISPPALWQLTMSYYKYFLWYLMIPLSVVIADSSTLSIVLIAFGLFFGFLAHLSKSELPAHGKLSCSGKFAEGLLWIGSLIVIGFQHIEGSVASWISIGVQFLCVLASWQYQIFWWYHVNSWYNLGLLVAFMLRISVKLLPIIKEDPNGYEYMFYPAIFLIVGARLGANLCDSRLVQRIKNCHKASIQDNFILFFTYDLCRQAEDDRVGSGQISKAILFEMEQIGRLSIYNAKTRLEVLEAEKLAYLHRHDKTSTAGDEVKRLKESLESEAKDPLWAFYNSAKKSVRTNSEADLFVILVLQLVFLGKNIMSISATIALYKKLLGNQWTSSFRLFLIESMFQGRLEHLSIEDSSQEHFSRTNMGQIMSEVSKDLSIIQEHQALSAVMTQVVSSKPSQNQSSQSLSISLDLSQVLKCKDEYIAIVSQINKLVNMKTEVFSTLFEKRQHKSHFLYKCNEMALKHGEELDRAFMKLMETDLVGNFVLGCAVAYFLKVRYDVRRAESVFKMYKNRLTRYEGFANTGVKAITVLNFQYNSVIMRISLGQDSALGTVVDVSPNVSDHLGVPDSGEAVGININTLFPGYLSQIHKKMMMNTADQPIFNNQQDFHLNGFDGYLRSSRYVLKLDPDIKAGLHSVALLRISETKDKSLVMLGETMQLLSADESFWRMMETFQIDTANLTDIRSLSETIPIFVGLMRFLRTKETLGTSELALSAGSAISSSILNQQGSHMISGLSSDLSRELTKALTINQLKLRLVEFLAPYEKLGVFHRIRDNLGVQRTMSDHPILTSFEDKTFGKEIYTILTVRFDSAHVHENNMYWNIEDLNKSNLQYSGNMAVDPDVFRLSVDSQSKDGGLEQELEYTVSARSHDSMQEAQNRQQKKFQLAASHNKDAISQMSFEKLLHKAKENAPLLELLHEINGRKYSEEVHGFLKWIEDFISVQTPHQGAKLPPNSQNFPSDSEQKTDRNPKSKDNSSGNMKNPLAGGILKKVTGLTDELQKQVSSKVSILRSEVEDSSANMINLPSDNGKSAVSNHPPKVLKSSFYQPKSMRPKQQTQNKEQRREPSPGAYSSTTVQSALPAMAGEQSTTVIRLMPAKHSHKTAAQPENMTAARAKLIESSKRKMQSTRLLNFKTFGSSKKIKKSKDGRHAKPSLAKETSFDDAKTMKSSVFSQLARSLFRYRGNQMDNTGKTSANLEAEEDLSPAAITKLAGDNALISHNPSNIQLITKYISDYKLIRKTETNPDEKNGSSVSSRTTSSRGSYYLKLVNTVMKTNKGGARVYLYTAASVLFSLYFAIVLQIVFDRLKSYNVSNLNNFILLSNFIFLDKRLLDACEAQELGAVLLKTKLDTPTIYTTITQTHQSLFQSAVEPSSLIQDRLTYSLSSLSGTVKAVTDQTINLVYKQDAANVVAATYRKEQLNYTDRFIPNATIYHPWEMPYFSTIIYYMNIMSKNKDALSALLSGTTNNELTTEGMVQSTQSTSRNLFGAFLEDMNNDFTLQVKNNISDGVESSFKSIYFLLYMSVGVACILFWYIFFAGFKINLLQKDYLMNYNMLRPWELFIMVEDLMRTRVVFTRYAFNEAQHLSEYLEFNLFSALNTFNNRVNKLQEQFLRDKDRAARVKKFRHDFLFFSSKFLLIFILITGLIFGVMGLAIYLFLNTNNNRIGVEMLLFDSHMHMVGIMKSYLSMTLLHIYGYYLPIAGTPISANPPFSDEFRKFLSFANDQKSQFDDLFAAGLSPQVDDLFYGDLCRFLGDSSWSRTANFEATCRSAAAGATATGLMGVLQYQNTLQDILYRQTVNTNGAALTASSSRPLEQPLIEGLFGKPALELRTVWWASSDALYQSLSQLVLRRVHQIKDQLEYYVGQVMQGAAVGIYIILVLVYIFAFRQQAYEIKVCYETFKLIDPFFLMNNRYLQYRFKAAYSGVD